MARKYLEAAELIALDSDPYAANVCVGIAVLSGIAAGDAICIAATGSRYSGQDHAAAAAVLEQVDSEMGGRLRRLVALKPGSHYGDRLLSAKDQTTALRDAGALVEGAASRLS
ncbi:hypothetical protein [Nocardioides ferulae]|uniref:hypothetical protein n=1 Tax=Nocardioides ferulae TaxID=2340821 RepID=UPI000EAF12EC|nr:hypothetical protein [Nocardioides ferulae]